MLINLCVLMTVAVLQPPSLFLAQAPATPDPAAAQPAEVKPAEPPAMTPPAEPAPPAPAPVPATEPAGPPQPQPTQTWGDIRLPETVSPADLNRLITDLPGTFEIVDIRPPDKFADYHIPDSRNVTIPQLVNNPVYLQSTTPLVIVDRDGSLAMAVGGIFAQRTLRPVKVLYGGLEAYWRETGLKAQTPPHAAPPSPPPGAPSQLPEGAPPAQPAPAAKRSAGC